MSVIVTGQDRRPALDRAAAQTPISLPMLVALGSLTSLALSWPHLRDVWSTGTFYDTDDAMRMVQVRDWLAGQGWFDLAAHRVVPPAGLPMHWSRIVDVPLARLIRLFAMATSPPRAELLMRIVFPLALQVALIAAFVRAAEALAGPRARVPSLILIVLSGFQLGQFVAGRIDHHAPQITLLVLMVGSMVGVFRRRRTADAILCAAWMAVSLGISLENLPFIAVLLAGLVCRWIAIGAALDAILTAFAIALIATCTCVFVLTIPPSRYLDVAADAFSIAHLAALVTGSIGLIILARLSPRLTSVGARSAAVLILGLGLVVLIAMAAPSVLHPYGGIDPVVTATWLSHVSEAQPLLKAAISHPAMVVPLVGPVVVGLIASAAAFRRASDAASKAVLGVVTALIAAGLVGACWEVRVIASVQPLSLLGSIWWLAHIEAPNRDARSRAAIVGAAALAALMTPFAWILLPFPAATALRDAADQGSAACLEASALAPLAALGTGIVFAPIDAGSQILVHTPLSVVGAPYHRNNAGNRAVIDGFFGRRTGRRGNRQGHGIALCRPLPRPGANRRHSGAGASWVAGGPARR